MGGAHCVMFGGESVGKLDHEFCWMRLISAIPVVFLASSYTVVAQTVAES